MEKIWTFTHEPISMCNMIASKNKKDILKTVINDIPNTLIAGHAGTGKGTFMNILLKETGCEYLKINGSDETGVDMIRDKVKNFSTSYSLKKKIVYINECDQLSVHAQRALNQIIEDVQHITRFFFICNNPSKLTKEILSRCTFKIDLNDPPAKDIFIHIINILKKENIKVHDKSVIIDVIKKLYPDIRNIIGTLQSNCNNGIIKNISYSVSDDVYKNIFKHIIDFDIEKVRNLLKSNYINYEDLYNHLYKQIMDDPSIVPDPANFILKTGEFLYKNETISIKEINFITYCFSLIKEGII